MTVLDIGCSDGFYSFECERRGATRVLAVDDFSSVYIDSPSGFDVAREALGSRVEFVSSNLFELSAKEIGTFDLVLFLGVLYHLRHPLLGLERLASLCSRQIIVETEIAYPPIGLRSRLLRMLLGKSDFPRLCMQFFPSDEKSSPDAEFNYDPTTFWAPSVGCAEAMLRLCGFSDVRTVSVSGSRGVFHGFSPAYGADAQRALTTYGAEFVLDAARKVLANDTLDSQHLVPALSASTVEQFGWIKQLAAEARAKKWHHTTRWQQTRS
jgi:tRNA (mo5U34)-methyltransferase